MIVYKKNKWGFIETLYTEGSYKPKGWTTSREKAERSRNGKTRK